MNYNKIYNENCLETMKRMEDKFIDLTVTSPPYDNLREYNGYEFDFKPIAKELFRVTKDGGIVVWVVGDATINGSETGTSFKQALYFKEIGFNLHDTMIWEKPTFSAVGALKTRYAQVFEYMFILCKNNLNTFNPIKDRKNIASGKISGNIRQKNGSFKKMSTSGNKRNILGQRFNMWEIKPESSIINKHPAPFPIKLAKDHIISWCNEKDLVYDPFMGSGTTAKAAIELNRNYIGSEISSEYCLIAEDRTKQMMLFT